MIEVPLRDLPESVSALSVLLQAVGYALWQTAECEDMLANVIVLRLRESQGIGASAGAALDEQAQGRTFGERLRKLRDSGLLDPEMARRLGDLNQERNWLVHHAKRENRGVLSDPKRCDQLLRRLRRIADEATELNSLLGFELEDFIVRAGVPRALIDDEAVRLLRAWGY